LAALAARQHGVVARRQLLAFGLSPRVIESRLAARRLTPIHRGVYAFGAQIGLRGHWLAAVLACGEGAVLSHRSAAALWGLIPARHPIEVSARSGRGKSGRRIVIHEGRIDRRDRTLQARIPVTTVARTLFDLAEVVDERRLERAFEEADRLKLLEMRALEDVCSRSYGRRALRPIRRLIEEAQEPVWTRSELEYRFALFCREQQFPAAETNVVVLGHEVDVFWPYERLIVELDGYAFHGHRNAFEGDRSKDTARQAADYRAIRVTDRRLKREPAQLAGEIRNLLRLGRKHAKTCERGQGTVEWIGLIATVALVLAALVAMGVRVPGGELAQAVASRMLCAAAIADGCGDEPVLIAAYGDEVGRLVRRHMPTLLFERGARALPVDFRRCRDPACGDGPSRGLVQMTDEGLHVTAFVHVVDCRSGAAPDCSGERAGNLYIQYWTYYADSATLRDAPLAGDAGYHRDDWEGVQIRIGPDGRVDERASSHEGYSYARSLANAGSDAGVDAARDAAELLDARPHNGWAQETRLLIVSGGSHAGAANGYLDFDRFTPGRRVHLVPLEPIAAEPAGAYRFAIEPPWRKRVWSDPEATGTD
jgi:very-short-patch-repair endonuclease